MSFHSRGYRCPIPCLSTPQGILGCHGLGAASIKMTPVYSEHHSDSAVGLMGKPLRWRIPSQSSDLLSRTARPKDDWSLDGSNRRTTGMNSPDSKDDQ